MRDQQQSPPSLKEGCTLRDATEVKWESTCNLPLQEMLGGVECHEEKACNLGSGSITDIRMEGRRSRTSDVVPVSRGVRAALTVREFRTVICYNFCRGLTAMECLKELKEVFGDSAPKKTMLAVADRPPKKSYNMKARTVSLSKTAGVWIRLRNRSLSHLHLCWEGCVGESVGALGPGRCFWLSLKTQSSSSVR
ncbi:unnamed protein product [Darwinula stevensoni]|uniref:Uncharacterized protein n=1 Tax=Darwinula stevensoni TaxID=69355 RepID=A0A7R8ZXI8_9CRUS|nr:unnamed protein product [Darwinula stevensoni]CAG0878621.1 unnamed protein product [Darwinula stevensoni]